MEKISIFEKYNNPRLAVAIYNEYFSDVKRFELEEKASTILFQCNRTEDLDAGLDWLVSEIESRLFVRRLYNSQTDIDSNGSWGNAIRTLEER